MADFNIRSDSVNVEDIMRQIRARIAEKRGVDYTEQEIQQLAAARLETFFDPQKVRSDLLEEIRRVHLDPNTELGEETLFGSHRPWLKRIRRLLRPILKLFINTTPLVHAAMVRNGDLFAELVHNLVVETTRLSLEIKNLKMRVESLSSRLDFDERRARALEGVVQYRPSSPGESAPAAAPGRKEEDEGEAESSAARSRRRRRRRGRRGAGPRPGAEDTGGDLLTAAADEGSAGNAQPRASAREPGDAGAGPAKDREPQAGPSGGGTDEQPGS